MRKCVVLVLSVFVFLCSGCASYRAAPLAALSPECVKESVEIPGLSIGCKSLSIAECSTYLDRNILKKGYQPVEFTFYNRTNQSYVFFSNRLSLPTTSYEVVAKKVKTSTAGRVLGYAVPTVFLSPIFIIPTVVDGICSYKSNTRLYRDFAEKAPEYLLLPPGSYKMLLAFIAKKDFSPLFQICLQEQDTHLFKMVHVTAN